MLAIPPNCSRFSDCWNLLCVLNLAVKILFNKQAVNCTCYTHIFHFWLTWLLCQGMVVLWAALIFIFQCLVSFFFFFHRCHEISLSCNPLLFLFLRNHVLVLFRTYFLKKIYLCVCARIGIMLAYFHPFCCRSSHARGGSTERRAPHLSKKWSSSSIFSTLNFWYRNQYSWENILIIGISLYCVLCVFMYN